MKIKSLKQSFVIRYSVFMLFSIIKVFVEHFLCINLKKFVHFIFVIYNFGLEKYIGKLTIDTMCFFIYWTVETNSFDLFEVEQFVYLNF